MSTLESTDPALPEIQIQNPNRYAEVRARRLRPWLECLVRSLAPEAGGLGVRFMSDRRMRRLNRDFRGIDRTTDVLSFPGGDDEVRGGHEQSGDRYLGDVAVSVPAARRQAIERGLAVSAEIRTLLLHGVLHCLGYDHETDGGEMAALEQRLSGVWVTSDG